MYVYIFLGSSCQDVPYLMYVCACVYTYTHTQSCIHIHIYIYTYRGEAAGAMEVVMSKVTLSKGDEKRGGMLKEVALDALGELCVIPGLLQELYINFDCSLRSPNLFQKLMLFLSKVSPLCVRFSNTTFLHT
jgi:hypothetical protein